MLACVASFKQFQTSKFTSVASDVSLLYKWCESDGAKLMGYVNADYVGNLDKIRSLTGYIFTLFGCMFS